MKRYAIALIASLLIILIIDIILYLPLKKFFKKNRIFASLYTVHNFLVCLLILSLYIYLPQLDSPAFYPYFNLSIGIIILLYIPKIVFIVFYHLGKLIRHIFPAFNIFYRWTALFLASVSIIYLIWSMTWGRYNYKVAAIEIASRDIPPAFDGFKIIHISDLHLGSFFKGYRGIELLTKKINGLDPDLIVFTGDMVNNYASELTPWIPQIAKMQAKYGKFACMGNHDYGVYHHWDSPEAYRKNLFAFYSGMEAMGFRLLDNESRFLTIGNDSIVLSGIENWGDKDFINKADIRKAIAATKNKFIILLSHDPTNWRTGIAPLGVHLTLSGHTHAMQTGIRIGNKTLSPAKYMHKEYDGLYSEGESRIYVSRGVGYIAFPGRIGLRPEFTQIVLRAKH